MSETHTCVKCKEEKGRSDFHKKQWKLRVEGTCIECRDGKTASGKPRLCSGCNQEKEKIEFHKKQWKLIGSGGQGTCICCKEQPVVNTGEILACSSCKESKDRAVFANDNECKLCFDATKKRKQQQEAEDRRKRQKLERQEREKIERKEQKRLYHLTYGVGYQLEMSPELQFKTEPLVNEALVGKYELVFYSSQNIEEDETENAEDICRTARGSMELSMKEWNDKQALFGSYDIDTRMTNGTQDSDGHHWGNHSSSLFIESVSEFDPTVLNGFNVFKTNDFDDDERLQLQDLSSSKGRKEFIMDREAFQNYEWWKYLHTHGEDEMIDEFCGGVMKIVAGRRALALYPKDNLHSNYYGRHMAWSGEGYDYDVDNSEWADKVMESYRNGSNSWMCQHLNVPAEVAFTIREFVTPPPVFYVEEGDLVLYVEESLEIEWNKTLIFRKVK